MGVNTRDDRPFGINTEKFIVESGVILTKDPQSFVRRCRNHFNIAVLSVNKNFFSVLSDAHAENEN